MNYHKLIFLRVLTNSILLSKAVLRTYQITHVLIINKIGILSRLYRYADINYVGGGFNNGIHNILEPQYTINLYCLVQIFKIY